MTFYRNLYTIVTLVSIIGALNWGAHAYENNIIEKIGNKTIENAIYYLIAICALISLIFFFYIRVKGWPSSESYEQQIEREKEREKEKKKRERIQMQKKRYSYI